MKKTKEKGMDFGLGLLFQVFLQGFAQVLAGRTEVSLLAVAPVRP